MKLRRMGLGLVTLFLLSMVLSACGGQTKATPAASKGGSSKLRMAVLMPGPVNDSGWNASAYTALEAVKKEFDVETAYTENVAQSDMEEYFRGYATRGYNLVIGHGFEFQDAAEKVAPSFPKVKFVVVSGRKFTDNLVSVQISNIQQGFIGGVVAGVLTKSGIIGDIGGLQVPPIADSIQGFGKGVRYVNPNAKVLTAWSGNNTDVAKVKETALAMIQQGADVVYASADQATVGAIEAAKEKGVLAIGAYTDQNGLAPNTVVTSAEKNMTPLFKFIVKNELAGSFKPAVYNLGFKEGAVYLSPFHSFDSKLTADQKAKIQAVLKDLGDGKIDIAKLP